MDETLSYIDEAISAMKEEAISARMLHHGHVGVANLYWLMRTLLARSMWEREIFGDVVNETLNSVRMDLMNDVSRIEEVLHLSETPFSRRAESTRNLTLGHQQGTLMQQEVT